MLLSSCRIVLVGTQHPGNIGSTARAMKTMGLSDLYLVNPKDFPSKHAVELSSGASDVLDAAIVVTSLDEAIKDCNYIFASSARPRELALSGYTPEEAAQYIASKSDKAQVAIVFGRESSGLSNEELMKCHYHLSIPSNPDYSSLNLSQAVQIIAYEIRMKLLKPKAEVASIVEKKALSEDVTRLYAHMEAVFIKLQFLKPSNPGRLMERVVRLFNRVELEQMEVNILRGILRSVEQIIDDKNLGIKDEIR